MIGTLNNLIAKEIKSPEAKNASMKVLISPKNGWEGYVMRVIEVEKHGYTPKHSHPWPHINFIIEGSGELLINGETTKVSAESYAFVPENVVHQFRNVGETTFKFICIVPEIGHIY